MRDEALVKRIDGPYAEVVVQPKAACHSCASRALCSINKSGEAILRVFNPLSAQPGDRVEIEIPEATYSHQLILIFGLLILISIIGAGLGTISSSWLSLSASLAGAIGFFAGAGLASVIIWKVFRRPNKSVFPVICSILNSRGGSYG